MNTTHRPTLDELDAWPQTGSKPIDVYPVGVLDSLRYVRTRWRAYRIGRIDALWDVLYPLRSDVRILAGWIRRRQWRAVKNHFNGYLAEPREMPDGLTRCGSGWTRRRALADLYRRADRAGVVIQP